MIDRYCPKMVSVWDGISSYKVYNGRPNQEDLEEFIRHIMERKKWIKFRQSAVKVVFADQAEEL